MAINAGVRVVGLKELRAALRQADRRLGKELALVNYRVAQEVVVPAAKRRAEQPNPRQGRPAVRPGRKVVQSIRALRQQRAGVVALGSAAAPHAAGHEFGSIRYPQFPAWRGNQEEAGYFVWPTIREKRDEIITRYLELLDTLGTMME